MTLAARYSSFYRQINTNNNNRTPNNKSLWPSVHLLRFPDPRSSCPPPPLQSAATTTTSTVTTKRYTFTAAMPLSPPDGVTTPSKIVFVTGNKKKKEEVSIFYLHFLTNFKRHSKPIPNSSPHQPITSGSSHSRAW